MEQRPADLKRFSIVRQHRRMLANLGFYLQRDSRILEFGCGSGQSVYEYRAAGFDAYGFDLASSVELREPRDAQYFRFASRGQPADIPDYSIDRSWYRIPFDDESFDFTFSLSVFEHVMDYDTALGQIARVLRPGGVAIHTFPSKYVPLEPHIFVPFGGVTRNYVWYLLWASLGVRNRFQSHLGPFDRAKINWTYARKDLNYLRTNDILRMSRRHFSDAKLIPHLWEMGDEGSLSVKGRLIHGLPVLRRLFYWLYNSCGTVVLYLRKQPGQGDSP